MKIDSRLDQATGLDFLRTEISSGMTFARMAREAEPFEIGKVERNRRNARLAYETVLRFRPRVRLSKEAVKTLESELAQLRLTLKELGEAV
jgi:hypothetical protein